MLATIRFWARPTEISGSGGQYLSVPTNSAPTDLRSRSLARAAVRVRCPANDISDFSSSRLRSTDPRVATDYDIRSLPLRRSYDLSDCTQLIPDSLPFTTLVFSTVNRNASAFRGCQCQQSASSHVENRFLTKSARFRLDTYEGDARGVLVVDTLLQIFFVTPGDNRQNRVKSGVRSQHTRSHAEFGSKIQILTCR